MVENKLQNWAEKWSAMACHWLTADCQLGAGLIFKCCIITFCSVLSISYSLKKSYPISKKEFDWNFEFLFGMLSVSEYISTVATRSGNYPAQMITAVNRPSPYPDQMVDQHLETTSTALNVSGDQGTKMSPRDRSPVRTSSPRQPLGKDH